MTTDNELQVGRRIKRTRELKGVNCPAFIHSSSYFFVNLKVYEDGIVDCWDTVDLPPFEDKVRSGWLETSTPYGEDIRIHGLGMPGG